MPKCHMPRLWTPSGDTARRALLEAADTRESLEKQLAQQAATRRERVEAKPTTTAEPLPVAERHERKGKRPEAVREPEPVKWWVPSYKAQFGKRAAKSRR